MFGNHKPHRNILKQRLKFLATNKMEEYYLCAMPSVLWSYHTRVPSSRHPTFIFGFDLPNCTPVYIPVHKICFRM